MTTTLNERMGILPPKRRGPLPKIGYWARNARGRRAYVVAANAGWLALFIEGRRMQYHWWTVDDFPNEWKRCVPENGPCLDHKALGVDWALIPSGRLVRISLCGLGTPWVAFEQRRYEGSRWYVMPVSRFLRVACVADDRGALHRVMHSESIA